MLPKASSLMNPLPNVSGWLSLYWAKGEFEVFSLQFWPFFSHSAATWGREPTVSVISSVSVHHSIPTKPAAGFFAPLQNGAE
jgi:hypothetical protein